MMKKQLYINDKDAFTTYGAYLDYQGVSALMTPAPFKERVENKSALSDGKEVSTAVAKYDERDITLTLYIGATGLSDLIAKSNALIEELRKPTTITVADIPGTYFHVNYISCTQFSQFNGRLAKYVLRLNEPNPAYRTK